MSRFCGRAKVEAGKPLKVKPDEDYLIHLSRACIFNGKEGETALLDVTVDGKKFVIGYLSQEKIPQINLDLFFEKEFELSHSLERGSVDFTGYKTPDLDEDDDSSSSEDYYTSSDSEEEEEVMVHSTITANGSAGAAASSVAKPAEGASVCTLWMDVDEDDSADE
ncbi:hypothetical protein F2Q70_00014633 [Brassica cretica]|uniref:Nucleoplasmin-like domain-containing protein n=1 Tax=Brassica cretica TaxID=69181 RepID=A0A8S9I2U4_BRACR|nr:hypothetical protein F2Q70_00014633 [Brassica cretica]KAF2599730.1 hypothetical protein F2Q68_00007684 [Brassica cretica]